MTKLNLKYQLPGHFSDVITTTTPKNVTIFFHFGPLPIKISGYARVEPLVFATDFFFTSCYYYVESDLVMDRLK